MIFTTTAGIAFTRRFLPTSFPAGMMSLSSLTNVSDHRMRVGHIITPTPGAAARFPLSTLFHLVYALKQLD
jgi:hypothetical protein